jgi:hypothetical protein
MNQTIKKAVTEIKRGIAVHAINFIVFVLKSTEYFCVYLLYFNIKQMLDKKQAIRKLTIMAMR